MNEKHLVNINRYSITNKIASPITKSYCSKQTFKVLSLVLKSDFLLKKMLLINATGT